MNCAQPARRFLPMDEADPPVLDARDPYGVPTGYVPRVTRPAQDPAAQRVIDAERWRAFLATQQDPDAVTADVDTIRGGL